MGTVLEKENFVGYSRDSSRAWNRARQDREDRVRPPSSGVLSVG